MFCQIVAFSRVYRLKRSSIFVFSYDQIRRHDNVLAGSYAYVQEVGNYIRLKEILNLSNLSKMREIYLFLTYVCSQGSSMSDVA